MTSKLRIQLRAVLYQEGGSWIAHCLEMDVMGHGESRDEALAKMGEAVALQVAQSIRHNNARNIFMPADPEVFEMYFAGENRRATALMSLTPVMQQDGVVVETVETREYACA